MKPRKRSWKRDEELFRLRVKGAFGSKRLTELTRQEVQRFHTAILDQGLSAASADHHVKLLRQMLNLAVEWELLDKNPLTGLKLFNVDNKIERYLDSAQLERLLQVLRTDPRRPVCRIAMFLLSTGCRLNEALRAKWDAGRPTEPGVEDPGVELEVEAGAVRAAERQRPRGAGRARHRGDVRVPVREPSDREALHQHHEGLVEASK